MNNNLEAGEFNIELKEEEPVWIRSGIRFSHCRFPSPPIT